VKVEAIYTTPYERTRQTAAPLAQALKLQPSEMKTGPTYAADVAARIRKEHRGGTIVVVGHSNSTVNVMKELGINDAPFIPESEYDNLFIVTLAEGFAPRMVALRYGAAVR
jgi:phosphohistidine phosphatase SixA